MSTLSTVPGSRLGRQLGSSEPSKAYKFGIKLSQSNGRVEDFSLSFHPLIILLVQHSTPI